MHMHARCQSWERTQKWCHFDYTSGRMGRDKERAGCTTFEGEAACSSSHCLLRRESQILIKPVSATFLHKLSTTPTLEAHIMQPFFKTFFSSHLPSLSSLITLHHSYYQSCTFKCCLPWEWEAVHLFSFLELCLCKVVPRRGTPCALSASSEYRTIPHSALGISKWFCK